MNIWLMKKAWGVSDSTGENVDSAFGGCLKGLQALYGWEFNS